MRTATPERSALVPPSVEGRAVLAKLFRAAGDPSRLALLAFLVEDEHSGNECVAHLGLAQGRVSAHLACLVSCGFVSLRRAGRFSYYRVEDERVRDLVRLGAAIAADNAAAVAACTKVG